MSASRNPTAAEIMECLGYYMQTSWQVVAVFRDTIRLTYHDKVRAVLENLASEGKIQSIVRKASDGLDATFYYV